VSERNFIARRLIEKAARHRTTTNLKAVTHLLMPRLHSSGGCEMRLFGAFQTSLYGLGKIHGGAFTYKKILLECQNYFPPF
jgi:hypothetical protein